MAEELNIITSDVNTVDVNTDERTVVITNESDTTTVTLSAAQTTVVQIATIGPQGIRGEQGSPGNFDASSLATTGSNTFIGNQIVTGSITLTSGITGSLLGTASFAVTASYALNAGAGAGFPFSGSAVITGSLFVTEGITGSFSGSVFGYVPNEATTSFVINSQTSSFVQNNQTSSFVLNTQTGSMLADYVINSQTSSFLQNNQTGSMLSSYTLNSQTSSFVTNSQTASFATTESLNTFTSSINQFTQSILNWTGSVVINSVFNSFTQSYNTGSFSGTLKGTADTASYYNETDPIYTAEKGKYLTTGSSNTTQTISGSLVINQNLTVLGSSSITYVTSSQLDISTNIIRVSTSTPAVRFGGLAVYDSGSTGKTGSILWDSQNDVWIYTNPSGAAYDGAMFLTGPKTTTAGTEVGITTNYLSKGAGEHHMTSSQISDDGTKVTIPGNLVVNSGITGSFSGSVVGYVPNTSTSSFVTNSQTSSFLLNTQTGSMLSSYTLNSQTSSFIRNTQTGSFATTGSNTFIGNQIITGSIRQTASTASFNGVVGIGGIINPDYTLDVSGSFEVKALAYYVGQSISNKERVFYVKQSGDSGYSSTTQDIIITTTGSIANLAWTYTYQNSYLGTYSTIGNASYNYTLFNNSYSSSPNNSTFIYGFSNVLTSTGLNFLGTWYIPTKDELQKLYDNRDLVGLGSVTVSVWSSTEVGSGKPTMAYAMNFSNGTFVEVEKTQSLAILPIRYKTIGYLPPNLQFDYDGIRVKNLPGGSAGYTLQYNNTTGQITYVDNSVFTPTAATISEINLGSGTAVVQPENLEQSKFATLNIFNHINFT